MHTDDITALAYVCFKDKRTGKTVERVATGELGKSPLVRVWDPKTMELLATWKG